MMQLEFIQDRVAQLRAQKGVSAREMSLAIGQNGSYINRIENKKALPSLAGLFYICEYLGVTPRDFFDEGNNDSERLSAVVLDLKKLDSVTFDHVAAMVRELSGKRKA